MKDKDKEIPENQDDDDKVHVDKSVFQTAKDIQQTKQAELEAQELEMQRQLEEREKKRREAYDRKILEEKKELLRLKQGTIEESEVIHEEAPEIVKLSPWNRFKNFIYHNKWWLWLAAFFVAVAIYLIYDLAAKEKPDIIILVLNQNDSIGYSDSLSEYVEQFSEDFNDNGEVLASVYYIPYTENTNSNYANGVDTKLTVELQSADSMIIIADSLITNIMDTDETLVNLEELFPDNPNVEGCFYWLKDSNFAERLGLSEDDISDDMFLAFRIPQTLMYADEEDMQETYDKDFPVFEKIIEDLSK
ncbi:MAG: hypothetical protein LUG91_02540 [Ruminococcus sp.]|nr:hypothetical protein [Ruminococcus sp.]